MNEYVLCEKEKLVTLANATRAATGSSSTFNLDSLVLKTSEALSQGGAAVRIPGI